MATNKEIRIALLKKLNVTKQRLSQLAKSRKNELPMTTEQAVYTIAHEHGVDIAKYLSNEETTEVRHLLTALRGQKSTTVPLHQNQSSKGVTRTTKPVLVSIKGLSVKFQGINSTHAREAKMMAEKVYPRLYLFENSLRDLIENVLETEHGSNWWQMAVPKKIQETSKEHKVDEAKDQWHGKRGDRELDYTLLSQLWKIIHHNWKHFSDLFPNQAWIEALITNDMNVSRRVIAHMNPLSDDDVRNIDAAFRKWVKQLKAIDEKLST